MDIDDFDEEMMLDEEDFAAHSPTGEETFDESGRFGNNRPVNIKIVDKNFFNDFPDLFDDDPPTQG